MSFQSHRRSASSNAEGVLPPGSNSSVLGGVDSEVDDGDEHSFDNASEKAHTVRQRVTSIADIVEITAPAIRPLFKSDFTARLLTFVGTLVAWKDPTIEDVVRIWNEVFGELEQERYHLYLGDATDANRILVVLKLAQAKVDSWRHKFADVAIYALEIVLTANQSNDREKIMADVLFYLEGTDHSCIFYNRQNEEDPERGKIKYKGIFQSYLCSRVFAVHCLVTTVDGELGPANFDQPFFHLSHRRHHPWSSSHIKRALNYYRMGKLVIPTGNVGHFSRTNWGDHTDFSEGVKTLVPSTSAITAVMKKLSPNQWDKIIAAAQAADRVRDELPDVIQVDAAPAADDFELVDDDSD
ncbi:hypothetical protein C8R43DRAFT_1142717 [Mycena crocata]|nr:hypothetical protein C8R43DRAFT_1142717 [Mycena crocata]